VHEQSRKFYRRAVELTNQPNLDAWYREWLENPPENGQDDEETALAVGLLELAAVYDSVLTIEQSSDQELLLAIEFPFEDEEGDVL
jgi:hypothetical protein